MGRLKLTFLLLLLLLSARSYAQTRPDLLPEAPFLVGEQLKYEARISRFPIYGTLGELVFQAYKESGNWRFTAEARSKGFLTSLFGIKVLYKFASTVDGKDFGVLKTEKDMDDGKQRLVMVAEVFRECGRVRWNSRDMRHPEQPVQSRDRETPAWVSDIIAAIYLSRYQKLNSALNIPISDNAELYNIDLIPLGQEVVETKFGKVLATEVEAKIFGGKLVRRDGKMRIWLSDDARRLPVKAQIKSSFGTVNFYLIEMKNVRDR